MEVKVGMRFYCKSIDKNKSKIVNIFVDNGITLVVYKRYRDFIHNYDYFVERLEIFKNAFSVDLYKETD